jgi:hypothetical protein
MHPTLVKKTLSTFKRLRLSPSPSTLRPKILRYFIHLIINRARWPTAVVVVGQQAQLRLTSL